MGKGSRRRPTQISQDVFERNWDRVFGLARRPLTVAATTKSKTTIRTRNKSRLTHG